MKSHWLSLMAHEYAQSAAVFLLLMMIVVYLGIRKGMKEDGQ